MVGHKAYPAAWFGLVLVHGLPNGIAITPKMNNAVATRAAVPGRLAARIIPVTPSNNLKNIVDSSPAGSILELADGTYSVPTPIEIGGDITIRAVTAGMAVLDGQNKGVHNGVLKITGGAVELFGLTITRGRTTVANGGAGLHITGGDIKMQQCNINSNQAWYWYGSGWTYAAAVGGGLLVEGGNLAMDACTVSSNAAAKGAGMYVAAGVVQLFDCDLSGNTGSTGASAWAPVPDNLHLDSGTLCVHGSTQPADSGIQASNPAVCSSLPSPFATPTAAPTAAPAISPTSAKGDPHLVNVLGQRFDIMQPGTHTLIEVPKYTMPSKALLRVQGDVARMGGACADMYFETINVTGKWVHARGGFKYSASRHHAAHWMRLGQVDLKVVQGTTASGIKYLNFFVKHLEAVGFPIGGLLGDTDHTAASAPSRECRHALIL